LLQPPLKARGIGWGTPSVHGLDQAAVDVNRRDRPALQEAPTNQGAIDVSVGSIEHPIK
jgi:hypothetical protein